MDSRDHTCVDSMEVGETITVVLKNPRALTEENFEVNVAMDMTLGLHACKSISSADVSIWW